MFVLLYCDTIKIAQILLQFKLTPDTINYLWLANQNFEFQATIILYLNFQISLAFIMFFLKLINAKRPLGTAYIQR